jgi:hypothetical protein
MFYSTKSTFVKHLYMYVPSIKDALLPLFIVVKKCAFLSFKNAKITTAAIYPTSSTHV